tara:strand:+ start:5688 stop:6842 length:1155 start_codon:yes stop_codon:yes gene_type:complete
MTTVFYNNAYALNNKPQYGPNDIIDFEVKMRPARCMIANSFRVNGILQVTKIKADGSQVPVVKADQVYMNPFVGAHGLFRNSSVSINGSVIENNTYYPAWAGLQKQKQFTLEGLNTSSDALVELCGTQNNIMLLGSSVTDGMGVPMGCPFSIKPSAAINGSASNLPQSKFQSVRIVFNMASPVECLYTTHKAEDAYMSGPNGFVGLNYSITQLQSAWYEMAEVPVPSPVTFQTCSLVTTTLLTNYATFAVTAPNLYEALSLRFIQQAHRNTMFYDNNLSEFVPGLEGGAAKTELTIDSNTAVVTYPIQSYADLGFNYAKSLGAGMKNSLTNMYLSKVMTFGIGFAFAVSANDRLAIAVQIDPTQNNPGANAYDVFMFLSGYAQI